jgi:hypothetical protein
VSRNGRFAFITNTASNTVSSYRIIGSAVSILKPVAASTLRGPIDMEVLGDTLVVLTSQGVSTFGIDVGGSLTPITSNTTVTASNGLAVLRD